MVNRRQFDVQVKETADENIVSLSGELDLAGATHFRSVIEPLISSRKNLTLNMGGLTYIDSTGMGILILILKTRMQSAGSFSVTEVPDKIRRLLDLTGITKFLPIADGAGAGKADDVS